MPSVALVVVSRGSIATLDAALDAVASACHTYGVELIVARATANAGRRPAGLAPEDVMVTAPADATGAVLRRLALARTRADIVTFVDEAAAPARDWNALLVERAGLIRLTDSVAVT